MTNRILAFLILCINLANLHSHAIYFCNIDCGYYSTLPGTNPISSHRSIDSKTSTAGKITVKRGTTVLVSGNSVYYPGETLAYTATTPTGQQLGLTIDNGAQFSNGYCQGKNRTYSNGNTLSGNIIMPTRNTPLPVGGFAPQGNVRLWVEWSSYSGDTIHVSPFFVLLNATQPPQSTQPPTAKPTSRPTQKPSQTPTNSPTQIPTQKPTDKPTPPPPTQTPTTTEPSVTIPTTAPTNSSTFEPTFEPTYENTLSPPPTQESIYMQPTTQPSVTNATEGPSRVPTQNQSISQIPTKNHTQNHMQNLTEEPTKTTSQPSVTNTTEGPSMVPTFLFTLNQSITQNPSEEPTNEPSVTNPTEGVSTLPSSVITIIPSIFPTIYNITKKHTTTGNSTYVIAVYAGAIGGSVCCMIFLICVIRRKKEKEKPLFMQIEEELHPVEIDMNITSR